VAKPRSIFNATITFGAVNLPIKLHSATQSKTVSFRQVHQTDGAPLQYRRLDPESGDEVPYSDVVKGYEVAEGEYIELSKEEVKAAAGEKTKSIPIEEFVDVASIDPEFFDKTYYVGVRDGGEQGYKALVEALERTGRAGIGRMTFHDREYLVAVRALDGVLGLHTMRFADEVVDPDDLELHAAERGPSDREVKMAGSLVEALAADFEPDKYEDEYRQRVLEMIEAKAKGKQMVKPAPEEPAEESDLLAALEASIKGVKR
jgi:DNA end-binding protein Ku